MIYYPVVPHRLLLATSAHGTELPVKFSLAFSVECQIKSKILHITQPIHLSYQPNPVALMLFALDIQLCCIPP